MEHQPSKLYENYPNTFLGIWDNCNFSTVRGQKGCPIWICINRERCVSNSDKDMYVIQIILADNAMNKLKQEALGIQ